MPTRAGSSGSAFVFRKAADALARPAPGRAVWVTAALVGAAAGLGQAPVYLPVATVAAFAALLVLLGRAASPRRAGWLGWTAGTGYFALTLSWIVEPFLVDIARHGWMAPFALVFLSAGLALFWGAAFAAAAWLGGPSRGARALAVAVTLSIAELLRSYILTGFPWALPGHAWVGWPPMQLASLVGAQGLTLLTLGLTAIGVALWPRRGALAGLAAVVAGVFAAGYLIGRPMPVTEGRPVARLVQPNIPQDIKWDADLAAEHFERYLAATAGGGADIVIWPETAIPYLLNDAGPALDRIARAAGVPVILGMQRWEAGRYYNSLVVLDETANVTELYDKVHLVPFGEYVPAPWLMERIGLDIFTADMGYGYSFGPALRLIEGGPLGAVLPLICYEAVFPQDIHGVAGRADVMVQITNDAWFGHVSGPYQHLAQARLRAVEQGVPLIRVANTGVSAVIGPKGRVLDSIPLDQAGAIDVAVPAPRAATLYSRTGDTPVMLLLALFAFGLFLRRLRILR
ncbi:apolipoprotein N-acyltransferase [Anianabacter salinae]|uniref:apolipoprotein N-acyltransferase n=1 Tax=Anianabacter salinae TaxID=2851023 RepID=UPI00225DDD8F|nr:apolipoprotein N-acyltransferase [Anianabacter salinae]MBV0912727.1 apolipoprotein N-acyltransferase [Anianabacter salinae]